MPKRILEMTAIEVARIREDGDHSVGGVAGLYLQIIGASRVWMFRYTLMRQRKRMGLGVYPTISLAVARESARAASALVQAGTDPKRARDEERQAARLRDAKQMTFKQAAEAFITEHTPGWKNLKHIEQWKSTLATYAYPKLGKLLLSQIDQAYVLQVVGPIWASKTETASRMRGRIEQILDWATVHGHRSGTNPARWRGQLEYLLPNPNKVAPVEHHDAVPFEDLPAVYRQLCDIKGQAARALRFVIFTGGRSGEVRGMKWSEVDLDRAVWAVPAGRMKANREHRVVLSRQAVEFLRTQPRRADREDLVFPSPRGLVLSDNTLSKLMRDHKMPGVPHGFRSTFRDWAGEMTNHPRDAIELCIAHVIDNETEAAYRRGDMIRKRVQIMQDWADYAAPLQP